jgi:transcriptional regulator with XRE-family HTH domain
MPPRHIAGVSGSLHRQLGRFLRRKRGDMTLSAFARKLGISTSSLQRMELGEQNVTFQTLEHLLKRLHCTPAEIFRDAKTDHN